MKKKLLTILLAGVMVSALIGCSSTSSDSEPTDTTTTKTESTTSSTNSSTTSSTSNPSIEHYCDAPDCSKEGTRSIIGISGEKEYYCSTHYDEMEDIMNAMVDDVLDSYETDDYDYDYDYTDDYSYDDYDAGYSYDSSDPYYSANDHNNDGYLTDEEFLDAMEDALDDYSYLFE